MEDKTMNKMDIEEQEITREEALAAAEDYFSTELEELLRYGWQVNAETMRGSQGEVAKVDLRGNRALTRLYIFEEAAGLSDDGRPMGKFRVGSGDSPRPASEYGEGFNVLWNRELVCVTETEFYYVR